MKINFSFLAATLYAISPIYAQAPSIQWQNTIGGSGFDIFYALQQTADGGYIVGGLSDSNISGDKTENSNGFWDYWVVKVDATGTIQWQNTIGGSGYESNLFLQQTDMEAISLAALLIPIFRAIKLKTVWEKRIIGY